MLGALARTACPYCGDLYGMAVAQEAERSYREHCQQVRAENPQMRIRFNGIWTVWCPTCDKSCGYISDQRKLGATWEEQAAQAERQAREHEERQRQSAEIERRLYGDRVCAGCGGRLRAWADEEAGWCARCHTTLPPISQEGQTGDT